MKTHCNQKPFDFQTQNSRTIVAHFNGGNITSDAGRLLLRQAERVKAQKQTVLKMEFKKFRNCFIQLPRQIVRAGRKIVYPV